MALRILWDDGRPTLVTLTAGGNDLLGPLHLETEEGDREVRRLWPQHLSCSSTDEVVSKGDS